jgi:hypothetical protein
MATISDSQRVLVNGGAGKISLLPILELFHAGNNLTATEMILGSEPYEVVRTCS